MQRLPIEALECTIMALKSNQKLSHCVICTVKGQRPSLIASNGKISSSTIDWQPIAFIVRTSNPSGEPNVEEVLGACQQIVEFPDQQPGSTSGWHPALLRFKEESLLSKWDIVVLRKRLSSWGKKLFGDRITGKKCVGVYDHILWTLDFPESFCCAGKSAKSSWERKWNSLFPGWFGDSCL